MMSGQVEPNALKRPVLANRLGHDRSPRFTGLEKRIELIGTVFYTVL
jgi:hypothetical protein